MSASRGEAYGDQARVSVLVAVEPELAFQIFTQDIDLWWRRGLEYRTGSGRDGVIALEAGVGGRLYESYQAGGDTALVETGRVRVWEPPRRLVLDWRAVNFAPGEATEVEVTFEPSAAGTRVTVTHRGWSQIRSDHPARHGLDADGFVRTLGLWWSDLLTSLRERAAEQRERAP